MSISEIYNDIGADSITITDILMALGLNPDELQFGDRFMKFKDVMEYLKDQPNYSYIIRKLTTGKQVDALQHLWEWTQLSKSRDRYEKELQDKKSILENMGEVDVEIADQETLSKYLTAKNDFDIMNQLLSDTNDEIKIYG
jgi:hypothetical protein